LAHGSLSLGGALVVILGYALVLAAISPARGGFVAGLFAMCLILFGFGRVVLGLLLGSKNSRLDSLLLALPVGVITLAGLGQVGSNLGLSITYWLLPIAAILAVAGCAGAWTTISHHLRKPLLHGWFYVGSISMIWTLYYLPMSQLDIVPTKDGGIKWWYADSFFHQAMTQELTSSLEAKDLPPRTPGFCRIPMCYQYGSHAVGSQFAYWLHMTVDDVTARGLTWIGLLALISATVSAGRQIAIEFAQKALTGAMALTFVFLLPSLQTLYANNCDSSLRHMLIVIPPRWEATAANMWEGASGLTGGSIVWTCIAAFTVLSILADDGVEMSAIRRSRAVLALATLTIGLNCVAALCCWGVGACYGLIHGWRRWTTYAGILAYAATFLCWFRFSGFDFNSGRYMTMLVADDPTLYGRIYSLVKNFSMVAASGAFLLLGIRSLAILSIVWARGNVKVVLLLFTVVYFGVYVTMTLLAYPILYLGMILSVFAAGPAAVIFTEFGTGTSRAAQLWKDLVRVFRKYSGGVWIFAAAALLPTLFTILRRRSLHGLPGFSKVLLVGFVLISMAYGIFRCLERTSWQPSRRQVLVSLVLISTACFLGALRNVLTVAANWGDSTIVLDAGRTQSLHFVRDTLPRDAILATSRHEVPTRELRERSLMYSAVTGRHILLEGWRYMTAQGSPEFANVCDDNATLFATSDEEEARRIVRKYGITHLLLEPGQSLGFLKSGTSWLNRIETPGSMETLVVVPDARKN
jgi:hypothetical protein